MKYTKFLVLVTALLMFSSIAVKAQKDCSFTAPTLIPLNDLGTGYFDGYQGGLYPSGSNAMPSGHLKKGKSIANGIEPLDPEGNVTYDGGVVLMAGFGPSIPGHLYSSFLNAVRFPTLHYDMNPCFDAYNLCIGGKGLEVATGSDSTDYFNQLVGDLGDVGYSALQVQIGWMYFNTKYLDGDTINMPATPLSTDTLYKVFLHLCKEYFPNMKIMYISSRHWGGFADPTLDQYPGLSEPASYYNGFSVKWLIEDQIAGGDPALVYSGAHPTSPYLLWGPYYWTNGANPRATDGDYYTCDDFTTDGYHLSDTRYDDDAKTLLNAVYNGRVGKQFVHNGTKWATCIPQISYGREANPDVPAITPVMAFPNPVEDGVTLYLNDLKAPVDLVEIYNAMGQLIYSEKANFTGTNLFYDMSNYAPGIYLFRIKAGNDIRTARVMKD